MVIYDIIHWKCYPLNVNKICYNFIFNDTNMMIPFLLSNCRYFVFSVTKVNVRKPDNDLTIHVYKEEKYHISISSKSYVSKLEYDINPMLMKYLKIADVSSYQMNLLLNLNKCVLHVIHWFISDDTISCYSFNAMILWWNY